MAMSFETYALYIFVFLLWGISIRREGGIGIGFRFLYAMHLTMFFLVGPVLADIMGIDDPIRLFTPFDYTIQLTLFGLLSYIIMSYWIAPLIFGRSKFSTSLPNNPIRLQSQHKLAWMLCLLGLVSVVVTGQTQGFATIGAVVGQAANLLDTGVFMLCLHAIVTKRYRSLVLVIPFILLRGSIAAALSGHAGQVFINCLVAVCLLTFSNRFTILRIVLVLFSAILILIPASMWLGGRDRLRDALKNETSVTDRVEIFISLFTEPTELDSATLINHFRNRGDFTELMAQAVGHTPAIQPYVYGETYWEIFPAVVPRFFWPDKTVQAGGKEFVTKYTGVQFGGDTSVGMSHMFEFYINFGPYGVIIGLAMMGLLMAYMEKLFYRDAPQSLFVEFTLIFINWGITFFSDRFYLLFMTLIPGLVFCYVLRYFLLSFFPMPYLINDGRMRKSTAVVR